MSHITKRATALKDADAIKKACKRIPDTEIIQTANRHTLQVKFKDWLNPITIDTRTGECEFDNWDGRWGDEKLLDKLRQGYAVEAAAAQAAREGRHLEEFELEDGSIKCVIPLGSSGYAAGDSGTRVDSSGWDV